MREHNVHPVIGSIERLRRETAGGSVVENSVAARILAVCEGVQRPIRDSAIGKVIAIECVFSVWSKVRNNIRRVGRDGDGSSKADLLPSRRGFVDKCSRRQQ